MRTAFPLGHTAAILVLAALAVGLSGAMPSQNAARGEAPAEAAAASAVSETVSPGEHRHAAVTPDSRSVQLLIGYCLLIALASMGGGWLPSLITLTHTRMQLMLSLVGGLMLGIGLLHMLPHAQRELGSDRSVLWMLFGILTMFFLIRAFHFHDHAVAEVPENTSGSLADSAPASPEFHSHKHHHTGKHGRDEHAHRLSWLGIAAGLTVHTLIDGIALAASVQADAGRGAAWSLFGLGTFLAIVLHKPLDAVSITSLMAAGGWSPGWRNAVNAFFALMCPLGAVAFFFGLSRFSDGQTAIVGCALAFSAGVFVCIALSDLLPEMEFHSHNRIPLTLALLLGIAIAWGITLLEPDHLHSHNRKETNDNVNAVPVKLLCFRKSLQLSQVFEKPEQAVSRQLSARKRQAERVMVGLARPCSTEYAPPRFFSG